MSDAERAAVVKARKEAGGKSKKKAKKDRQASVSGVDSGDGNGDGSVPAQRQRQQTQVTSLGAELILEGAETKAAATPTRTDDMLTRSTPVPLSV
jgi:hypothetical protein